jgi:hypothetical protein
MVDPLTAVATATASFNTIKRMVSMGQNIESTFTQIGKWYGAISDLNEAEREAKNPPLFKKIIAKSSVEEEAINIFAAKKKALQQEKELRELLLYSYGPNAYQEILELRRSIKTKRENTIYAQARRRKAVFWITVQSIAIVMLSSITYKICLVLYEAIQSVN